MTHLISQIANFESCNAGIPDSLVRDAAIDYIREVWQDNAALIEAYKSTSIDIDEEVKNVNEALEEAGCETRCSKGLLLRGFEAWIEIESLAANEA